jgi:O-Antigen ligase
MLTGETLASSEYERHQMQIVFNQSAGKERRRDLSAAARSISDPYFTSGAAEGPMLRILGLMTYLVLVAIYLADGILPQVQMFLTGGSTPMTSEFKLLLLFLVVASVILTRSFRKSQMVNAIMILAAFMFIDSLILLATTKYQALDILNSFRGSFFPLILCGIVMFSPVTFRQRDVLAWGTAVFIACITISIFQFTTDTSVLPTRSRDGTFAVQSLLFYDRVRAFSLFTSSLQAGVFYCIPAALGAVLLLMRRHLLVGSLLFSLSVFGSYAAFTRLSMLGLGASVLSAIIMWNPRLTVAAKVLPLIWGLIAVLTISTALRDPAGSRRSGVLNTESAHDRLDGWRFYGDRYGASNLTEMLFGTGMTEHVAADAPNQDSSAAPTQIDNAFLQILLHSGLLLLCVVIYYYVRAWRLLYNKVTRDRTPFGLSAGAVFSTTPLLAAINDFPLAMFALFTIAMMIKREGADLTHAHSNLTRCR